MAAAKPRTHRKSAASKKKTKRSDAKSAPAKKAGQNHSVRREIYGVLVAVVTLLLLLSLVSHRPASEAHNWIGKVGQVTAEGVFFLFGISAFGVVACCAMISLRLFFSLRIHTRPTAILGATLITLALVTGFSVLLPSVHAWAVPVGGWIGTSIAGAIVGVIGRAGAVLVLIASALIGAILITRASLVEVTTNAVQRVQDTGDRLRLGEGVRAVTGSVTGLFARRQEAEAPPLDDFDDEPDDFDEPLIAEEHAAQIGRASCRERVEGEEAAEAVKGQDQP